MNRGNKLTCRIKNSPLKLFNTRPGVVICNNNNNATTSCVNVSSSTQSWVSTRIGNCLPANAVCCGNDTDGTQIFVGRAKHLCDQLPCKVIPSKRAAYVSYGGHEILKDQYEVLCGTGFNWIPCSNGNVPAYSVVGGNTANNELLYIGRTHFSGSLTPGKIHKSHNCMYFPYNGIEQRTSQYEVLVQQPKVHWIRSNNCCTVPSGAIRCGHDSDGSPMYVGRAMHLSEQLPAKILPNKKCAYVSYAGCEIVKHEYDVLCKTRVSWIHSGHGQIPANAVQGGRTSTGEILYIGRVHWQGSLTMGKVHPSHGSLYIAYGGIEIPHKNYEILIEH